ncbi:hypothetical protein GCM10022207_32930 [Streptomyces lannensis]|uniref:Uncharacterized protein n=1 Tax=Streptomyces lannensis TaxID=766498 RepID=A0ABP7K6C3_9ACTN
MVEPGPKRRALGAITVLNIRRDDVHGQEKAKGVGDQEPLAAFDLLAGVEAPGGGGDGVGSADRLGVDQARTRLGVATVDFAELGAQCVVDALDRAIAVPPSDVPVHRWPRCEILRQLPPSAAGPHDVEDRVHDPPPRMLLPPPALRSHPCGRQQRFHQRPLFVRQVRRIPTPSFAHMRLNDHPRTWPRQISNAV